MFGLYEEVGELLEKTPIYYVQGWSGIKAKLTIKLLIWSGKILGKWAKEIRKNKLPVPFEVDTMKYGTESKYSCRLELGDVHWMLVNIDAQYGFRTPNVEDVNIDKLTNRKNKNQIIDHPDH